MSELFFLDTNVLVYAQDVAHPNKNLQARSWLSFLWRSKRGRLSVQVLNEYFEVVRRKGYVSDLSLVEADINRYKTWAPSPISFSTLEMAFRIRRDHAISWWDSLLVSSAIQTNTKYLLSEDFQSNQLIDSVRVINPFEVLPEKLL